MTTKILLHMSEPAGISPSDEMGNLTDLSTEAGIDPPRAVDGTWTGRGRGFSEGAGTGHVAADLPGRDTLLQRDVTVQALLALELIGGVGKNTHTLICRGLSDGTAAERVSYCLRIVESNKPGLLEVSFLHQDSEGVDRPQPPGVFQHLGDGMLFMLTATRRWVSPQEVVCRYYVGDQLLGELVTTDGDIAGATTGHTSVGARRIGADWTDSLNGLVDELKVTDHEMSPEEVRETWRRLTVHQPAGIAMVEGLAPPGAPWFRNPGNKIGRRWKVIGQGLGLATANAEALRAQFLPDAMPLELAPRWEKLLGIPTKPRDPLDVRRARAVGYLSREEGFHHAAIKAALAEPMALAPEDVELIELTNEIRDDFDTLEPERWFADPPTRWAAIDGSLRCSLPAGTEITTAPLGPHARTPLDTGGANGRVYLKCQIKAVSTATLPTGCGVGLLLCNRATNDAVWFGVWNDAGTLRLGWQRRLGEVTNAIQPLGVAAPTPIELELFTEMASGGIFTPGQFWMVGSGGGITTVRQLVSAGVVDSQWGGLGVFGSSASTPIALSVDIERLIAFCPDGDRPFFWYALRPPGLSGTPDMTGAHDLVERIKPGHTYSTATQSRSVLCDDPRDGLCDRGPLGAL
ncbi:MAG: hypothetical protein ACTHU0_01440 [Kofleriaceae bacterium]